MMRDEGVRAVTVVGCGVRSEESGADIPEVG
jgi:hypothetical protein